MNSDDVDRLSTLPEEIITHILSLMPPKFAVRTRILSTRWRYTWTNLTNLDFRCLCDVSEFISKLFVPNTKIYNKQPIPTDNCQKFVDRVLQSCRSPQIQLFRVHESHNHFSLESLSNWIEKAVLLKVSKLDIMCHIVKLPLNLLTCKTLTKLRLYVCRSYYSLWEPLSHPVNLPCLKSLEIIFLSNPFVNAFKLINGCPILESLSLGVDWRTEEDEDESEFIFNLPTLKRLKIIFQRVTNKVILHVPNLENLLVGGQLNSLFVMEDVSSLVEASILLDNFKLDYLWVELLKGLNGIKSLSAQISSFMYLETPLTCSMPIFLNMEHLELKGFHCSQLVFSFLESSPQLIHLCIEKDESFYLTCTKPHSVPSCMRTNLATIKFLQCDGHMTDMEFLEYMLGNSKVLKTVIITWNHLCTEKQMKFAVKVLNFPRASTHCEIYFI